LTTSNQVSEHQCDENNLHREFNGKITDESTCAGSEKERKLILVNHTFYDGWTRMEAMKQADHTKGRARHFRRRMAMAGQAVRGASPQLDIGC